MAHRRARVLISCTALSLAATTFVRAGSAHAADPSNCDSFTSDLFQIVNPDNQANLLTRSTSEVAGAARFGFTDDRGVLARVARVGGVRADPGVPDVQGGRLRLGRAGQRCHRPRR